VTRPFDLDLVVDPAVVLDGDGDDPRLAMT
jgi:hypothetical protein